ncbi:lantibiotic dehydratase [Actinocrispum wychmicini]|uniref:Thiopeptide-type bacteriocin biosynthesis protein n=1 Tax=Actinocrispum wychmicini TaxID=1213861 RepID=A0A4R2IQ37_9PSEU|nr:lantibiotic dehydratase [Actinocrispum wychmicini]TCO46436.1 thiopeptide-type bacteriocin biosynthesis protein [Actinocrispum wychmicini]
MFTVIDAVMLRLAIQPSNVDDWPDLTGGHVPQWRDWLTRTWADEAFAHAVEAASPDLARRVIAVRAGYEQRSRQVRGAVLSVLRYRLRASSRATPFGLFAGVTPAAFGPATTVRIGHDHRATTRVDAVWLARVVTELEHCAELAARLSVMVNNVATVRDGRLVIGLCQDPTPAAARTDPAEVSIRYTAAIEQTVQSARTPIRLRELADRLAEAFPGTTRAMIMAMLGQLVEQRVLISSLRPPMTVTDPLAHVLTALANARASDVPAATSPLIQLRERVSAGPVDLRVDADVILPRSVATEVARAAGVLARLTPHPFGKPIWLDYHARFLERYGIGAAVPLLELVNPDIGFGFPAGYRGSLLERPVPTVSKRDAALLGLAQTAALNRRVEVALDDAAITQLQADNLVQAQWPPHTELAVRVHAPSRTALDRGEYELVVASVFRAAGTTTGRFLDLLDAAEQDRMDRAYAGLPAVNDGALRVQVSCPPLYTETENVARSRQVLPDLLSIGEHRPDSDAVLTPEDLLVVGDAHRFYLWSRSRARPVEPEVFSAVEFTNFAHPLLRFVCELAGARTATCGPFSWGTAGQLPFLPRLTYRRTVLSPARWALAGTDLPAKDASWSEWTAAVSGWRERMMVPAAVYLGGNDQRIRLNLDEPAHLPLLRAQLDRHGHATVHEAPATDAFGWLDGHAHEIIVPLATTQARTWPRIPARTAATTAQDAHLPGAGEWLFCKLYGHPDRHTALLTTHLPELLSTMDDPAQWWFLPYRDPDNHLRLRIRLTDPECFGPVAARLGAWVADLRRLGLIATMQLDTYRPETGRFGYGPAMTAAEAAFTADSAAALAQRAHLTGRDAADGQALTAASLFDLAAAFTGDHKTGAAWLIEHIATDPVPAPERAVYDQALHLADPRNDAATVRELPGGEHIAAAWDLRRSALASYRDTLTLSGPAPDTVLASLLHLHCIRTSGIAPDVERICHRLARAAALSQTTRPKVRS